MHAWGHAGPPHGASTERGRSTALAPWQLRANSVRLSVAPFRTALGAALHARRARHGGGTSCFAHIQMSLLRRRVPGRIYRYIGGPRTSGTPNMLPEGHYTRFTATVFEPRFVMQRPLCHERSPPATNTHTAPHLPEDWSLHLTGHRPTLPRPPLFRRKAQMPAFFSNDRLLSFFWLFGIEDRPHQAINRTPKVRAQTFLNSSGGSSESVKMSGFSPIAASGTAQMAARTH